MEPLVTLENEFWQTGILPETGASVAFGRVRQDGAWVDVLRPTDPADFGRSGSTSSFIMMPWCNRIRAGRLQFQGQTFHLKTGADDGHARHGDVRQRQWQVDEASLTHVRLTFRSTDFTDLNWPFRFNGRVEYRLDERDYIWTLDLTNTDDQAMPGGFGFHPYFVRTPGVQLEVPCDQAFEFENLLAVAPPVPVPAALDFRQMRAVPDGLDNALTGCTDAPTRLRWPETNVELHILPDALYRHILIFTPNDGASVAVEPMTNINDGFNLHEQGIAESGVFVLQPGETINASVRLRVV